MEMLLQRPPADGGDRPARGGAAARRRWSGCAGCSAGPRSTASLRPASSSPDRRGSGVLSFLGQPRQAPLAFEVVGVAAQAEGVRPQPVDGVLQAGAVDGQLVVELDRHRALPGGLAGVAVQVEQGCAVELLGELQAGVGASPAGGLPGRSTSRPSSSWLLSWSIGTVGHPTWASRPRPGGSEQQHIRRRYQLPPAALQLGRSTSPVWRGARWDRSRSMWRRWRRIATLVSMSCTWPQLARIRRTGDIAGVSITAAALTVSSELGWTLYLGGEGLWAAVPEGLFNIAANVALVVALVPLRSVGADRPRGRRLLVGRAARGALAGWPDGDRRAARFRLRRAAHAGGRQGLADVEAERDRRPNVDVAPRRGRPVGSVRIRPATIHRWFFSGSSVSPRAWRSSSACSSPGTGRVAVAASQRPRHSCWTMRWWGRSVSVVRNPSPTTAKPLAT